MRWARDWQQIVRRLGRRQFGDWLDDLLSHIVIRENSVVIRENNIVIRENSVVIRDDHIVIRENNLFLPDNHVFVRDNQIACQDNHGLINRRGWLGRHLRAA
jgi:uncharacterized protein YacL (UPF0231 family)